MILQVNDEYRIASDDMQWIIQQLPKRDETKARKTEAWKNVAYLSSLDAAIVYLAERRIRMIAGTLARHGRLTATDRGAGRYQGGMYGGEGTGVTVFYECVGFYGRHLAEWEAEAVCTTAYRGNPVARALAWNRVESKCLPISHTFTQAPFSGDGEMVNAADLKSVICRFDSGSPYQQGA